MRRLVVPAVALVGAVASLAGWAAADSHSCLTGPRSKCAHTVFDGQAIANLDLSHSDFAGAQLEGTTLTGVTLSYSSMLGANLAHAVISNSRLVGLDPLVGRPTALMFGAARLSGVRLSGELQYASFVGARLVGDDLSGAVLAHANFDSADLRHANLTGADLRGAHLIHAQLSGANLSLADLTGADLSGAVMRGTILSGTRLVGARLREVDARGARLRSAVLLGADLTAADLAGAQLGSYGRMTISLGPRWIPVARRFPRAIDLAARTCHTVLRLAPRSLAPSTQLEPAGDPVARAHRRWLSRYGARMRAEQRRYLRSAHRKLLRTESTDDAGCTALSTAIARIVTRTIEPTPGGVAAAWLKLLMGH
jgi:uncharacterized protein YjbI with pentapeptide repeats